MKCLKWVAVLGVAGVGTASAYAYSGFFNFAAREQHWPVVEQAIGMARDRSIHVHAADVQVPQTLGDSAVIVQGVQHYRAHCAVCHGAPGVAADDMANGMYPSPPDLRKTVKQRPPADLFWIVKNGVKMSGMPSWADHGDDELWQIIAFLEVLPSLTVEDYAALSAEADKSSGGRHGRYDDGMMPDGGSASSPIPVSPDHEGHAGHHH